MCVCVFKYNHDVHTADLLSNVKENSEIDCTNESSNKALNIP